MDPIDLIPENFRAIASLVTQEAKKLSDGGMSKGWARLKAHEVVAPIIRPPTTAQELSSWLGKQARNIQLGNDEKPKAVSTAPTISNTWIQDQAWVDDEPTKPKQRAPNQSEQLREALGNLKSGQAKSTRFETHEDARRCQSILAQIATQLGWRQNGARGYETEITRISDTCWKLKVTRL